MIEFSIDGSDFEDAQEALAEVQAELAVKLLQAARRIGARVNATAKRKLKTGVYDVEIPFRKRLRGERLEKARRQVGAGAAATEEQVLERVRKRFGGSSSGQPFRRWTRTGYLLGQEGFEVREADDGPEVILYNAASYAGARNALGGPASINKAGRKSGEQSGNSPTKEVHWLTEAAEQEAEWIGQQWEEAARRAFERLGLLG